MISRLARDKLKPLIFSHIQISYLEFELPNRNIFIEYIKNRYSSASDNNISNGVKNSLKKHFIETGKDDFKSALIHTFGYAKQFHLNCIDRAGYHLYSITRFFNNLSTLKLSYCYIPLVEFADFGNMLPNLTRVYLCAVHFTKLRSDKISSKDITYPPNIRILSITGCDVVTTVKYSNGYDFLFKSNIDYSTVEFILPNISMPSLRELTFFDKEEISVELADFLGLNPNLEALSARFFYLNEINTPNSLKKLNLEGVGYDEDIYRFPNLESLKNLSISINGDYLYDDVKQLCLNSPNLECLELFLCSNPYNHTIFDNYLDPIISNLPNLKALKLDLDTNENQILDFSKFTQIETLSLHMHSNAIVNFNFTDYSHLKKIELFSNLGRINVTGLKEKFNSYENWTFSMRLYSIVGFKRMK
ncbi:hypothetical protein CONCODRAFT_14219 [Conidiobolus coronatus NRRL 28638]|uniref:RNI-like protein n=1 Tax=Conidiobolus coronatus (strain ATCC 28846 / CBS 209.66 / NRRL 28638) TaxID=796925 RepID=A0A137NPF0_CONC2|nr:hypothetical protein CONCODRAFT_14219 [Conidiobolus coronatus NRRL 28638]|eukprot:KXN64611.1 hypothetical protein CONCODRAFT_14219 [Conidiobolus coronatus NRRL 28638]